MYLFSFSFFIHTNASHKETAVLPTKVSSDDYSGLKHSLRTKTTLPLAQGASAVSYNTRLF